MDILDQIVQRKRAEVVERQRARPFAALRDAPAPPRRDFEAALRRPGLSVIAEIKRRSPSRGPLRSSLDPAQLARAYEQGGAAALSVLTDSDFFGGSDQDLITARAAVALPVLRKDFTIDAYQVHEARAIGADAILLIARILDDATLRELLALARELGLAALVEAHDALEIERALRAGARIVGVNSRDLATFAVNFDASLALRPRIGGAIAVAESGIRNGGDARRAQLAGFDAILVGESLVRADDPTAALGALLGGCDPADSRLSRRTRVKICGITNASDAAGAAEAGADSIGLVFANSVRKVTVLQARGIIAAAPPFVNVVGVFVDSPPASVIQCVAELGLHGVQLHGGESDWQVAELASALPAGVRIIRQVRVEADDSRAALLDRIQRHSANEIVLLDPGSGSGRAFCWEIARGLGPRAIVSGGLTPATVGNLVRLLRPFGVDVSSGVESSPGRKDAAKMRAFVDAVRLADAGMATDSDDLADGRV